MKIARGWLAVAAAGAFAAGCSIGVLRDLHGTTPSQVVFDDACGVQDYYDTIALRKAAPPTIEVTSEMESREGKRVRGGHARYAFQTEYQLKMVRKILTENYSRVPEEALSERPVKLEVFWSEKAGVKRVVTDRDAELIAGNGHWSLPPHQCLSELLFGEELYRTRRTLLGLPPLQPTGTARSVAAAALRAGTNVSLDGGTDDGARTP